jgi:hypothetical protein
MLQIECEEKMTFDNYIYEFLDFASKYFNKKEIKKLKSNFEENFGIYDQIYFDNYIYNEYSNKSFENIDNKEFVKTGFYKSKDGLLIIEQQIF